MRFTLYFTLENPEISIQYRKSIISFFKHSLSNYDEEYCKKYYNDKEPIIKNYAFSTYFPNQKIHGETITVPNKEFEINITTSDYETGIILYNSFNRQKYKKCPLQNNSMTLSDIVLVKEKEISSDDITIKFQAPLCVRSRQDNKDYYYSYDSEKFQEILKINIKEQLKITNIPISVVDTFEIKPIKAKKIIVKFYEKCLECSTGIFELKGNKELLTYLYKAGMGSKHSAGFGMFQVI